MRTAAACVDAAFTAARDLAIIPDQLVAECDGLDDTLAVLAAIRKARINLTMVERHLEQVAADQMRAGKPHTVDGLFTAVAHRGKERKRWQHDDLVSTVVERAFVDADGVKRDPHPDAYLARDAITAAAGFSYWRVGRLRDLGIAPDEYCEATPGRATVELILPEEGP